MSSRSESARRRAEQFVTEEQQFHLGFLPTEQSHPRTRGLDAAFAEDTARGVRMLQDVDRDVLAMARRVFVSPEYAALVAALERTVRTDHRVVFSGCGATGRLSILLESLWRTACARLDGAACWADRVESIMTGGDYALVKSVEFFEDYASFGRRQVEMARLGAGDTLVAITEGGETSSVLGTVAAASEAGCAVFLLFNNPAALLSERLERCRAALSLPGVTALDLFCGPMALAGSTRMQATTSEQLVAGAALETVLHRLLGRGGETDYAAAFDELLDTLGGDASVAAMARYIDFETDVYRRHGKVTYFADEGLLDIFTDTTERSPTFMLPPFRRHGDTARPAPWTFVKNPLLSTPDVWRRMLRRPLRCLGWERADYEAMGAADRIASRPPAIAASDLLSFDIGRESLSERHDSGQDAAVLVLVSPQPELEAAFAELSPAFAERRVLCLDVEREGADLVRGAPSDGGALGLMRHLALKLTLNTISTGVMTCLGRVSGNWMSWVDCTNKKLLDRGARLLVELAETDYRTAVTTLFEALDALSSLSGEKPSPVQVALEWLRRPAVTDMGSFLGELNPGWELRVRQGERTFTVTPADMEGWEHDVGEDGVHVDIWTGHADCGEAFAVVAEWRREDDGRFAGRLRHSGCAADCEVREVAFPLVSMHLDVDAQLLMPIWDMGFALDARDIGPGYDLRRQVECMQFCAVLRPHGQSVYVDCRDSSWRVKQVRHRLDSRRRLQVCFCHLAVASDGGELPFECSVIPFEGGWYEATQLYRPWALRQPWATGRRHESPLADVALWVWNRGGAEEVIAPVERLRQDLPGLRLALDWYWWHSNPYDTNYPFFWPPREGEEAFRAAAERLRRQGIYAQVYVNGVCWDMDAPTWEEGGRQGALRNEDGSHRAYAFNQYNHHRLAWMCGEAPAHHDHLSGLVRRLREAGMAGQYLDMIGCASYYACWNPEHRHAPGDPSAPIAGYRRMLARLDGENPGFPITTECANEAYMDLTEGGIICSSASCERMGMGQRTPLPLFTAVYHGSYAVFGNYALPDGIPPWDPKWPDEDRWRQERPWHRLYPEQFFVEMARPVVWGAQPMVCSLRLRHATDPEFRDEYQFILDTATFYDRHRKFLFAGRMLAPGELRCEERDIAFHSRMIFTKESAAKTTVRRLPCVLHSCWEAPDGERALILANVTGETQDWVHGGLRGALPPRSYACVALP